VLQIRSMKRYSTASHRPQAAFHEHQIYAGVTSRRAGMLVRMTSEKDKVPATNARNRIVYWIFIAPILLFLVWYGVNDLRRTPDVVTTLVHLGYPWYFGYFLGIGKLLALLTFAYPGTRRLREWAYAGFTIELLCAFGSHVFAGDPWGTRIAPLVFLAILGIAYWFDPYRK
jgi:DoxX-like family